MKASEWIMGFAAVGTWLVALLAVFGEWIRSRLFRPKLLVEPLGLTDQIVPQNNGMDARYYHVRVRNFRRFPAAHEVEILITLLEQPNASGEPYAVFSQTLPLWWVRQEILPLRQTIGPAAEATLFYVRQDGAFDFTPMSRPITFQNCDPGGSITGLPCKPDHLKQSAIQFGLKLHGTANGIPVVSK
jgi:hypothetical protein